MSDSSDTDPKGRPDLGTPPPRSLPVHHDGLLLVGWAIHDDAVLVAAAGLDERTEVGVGDSRLRPERLIPLPLIGDAWEPWTLLLLPAGSLPVEHDAVPPGFVLTEPDDSEDDSRCDNEICKTMPWLPWCR